jgi:hypothetical protein
MITFHAIGDWLPGQVRLSRATQSSRRSNPEVDQIIEITWSRELSRLGAHLFDGPLCRIESFEASSERLELVVSETSYKPFVGTNLHNPQLAERFGREVMANPVGVSTLIETTDGFLMLGRRNSSVVYYPHRVHPFAGSLEPKDGSDPFSASYRELGEELSLGRDDVLGMRCIGMAEDSTVMQPELIFAARTRLDRNTVESRLVHEEHGGTRALATHSDTISATVRDLELTPIAVASLLLWGRLHIDEDWFHQTIGGIQPRPLVPKECRP